MRQYFVNIKKFVIIFSFIIGLNNLFAQTSPYIPCDFETGVNINGPVGVGTGCFQYRGSGGSHSPVISSVAIGTNYCVVNQEPAGDSGSIYTFYIAHPDHRPLIAEANGANRFCAWIKLPYGRIFYMITTGDFSEIKKCNLLR